MFERKFSKYDSVFSLVAKEFAVPTAIGAAVLLITKVPKIIKTAKEIKKQIPEIQKMLNGLTQTTTVEQPQEAVKNVSKIEVVKNASETSDDPIQEINDTPVAEVETSTENTTSEEVPVMG